MMITNDTKEFAPSKENKVSFKLCLMVLPLTFLHQIEAPQGLPAVVFVRLGAPPQEGPREA